MFKLSNDLVSVILIKKLVSVLLLLQWVDTLGLLVFGQLFDVFPQLFLELEVLHHQHLILFH